MIYSPDINKICALCVKAKKIPGNETHMQCTHRNGEVVPLNKEACDFFAYDILKRPVRRRKKSTGNFSPEDFQL
ncbi:MAG: hypothetical protein UH081_08090 [Clostridia bacterium]|nr:hypothetical protein [Clostridia bacterium]